MRFGQSCELRRADITAVAEQCVYRNRLRLAFDCDAIELDRSSSSIASAAAQASSAWSGSSSGAFQNAMMQSPMYLSIVPRRAIMISLIGVSKRLADLVLRKNLGYSGLDGAFLSHCRLRRCGSCLGCSGMHPQPT
jgi:hypothetical protein